MCGIIGILRKSDVQDRIDDDVPVIMLSSNDALNEKTQSNAAEVAARGARLIEVCC